MSVRSFVLLDAALHCAPTWVAERNQGTCTCTCLCTFVCMCMCRCMCMHMCMYMYVWIYIYIYIYIYMIICIRICICACICICVYFGVPAQAFQRPRNTSCFPSEWVTEGMGEWVGGWVSGGVSDWMTEWVTARVCVCGDDVTWTPDHKTSLPTLSSPRHLRLQCMRGNGLPHKTGLPLRINSSLPSAPTQGIGSGTGHLCESAHTSTRARVPAENQWQSCTDSNSAPWAPVGQYLKLKASPPNLKSWRLVL